MSTEEVANKLMLTEEVCQHFFLLPPSDSRKKNYQKCVKCRLEKYGNPKTGKVVYRCYYKHLAKHIISIYSEQYGWLHMDRECLEKHFIRIK